MGITALSRENLTLTYEAFYRAIGSGAGFEGARPSDDDPLPPGPWDPMVRAALRRLIFMGPGPQPWWWSARSGRLVAGPLPDPWLVAFGMGFDEVMLNPQPLPPREGILVAIAEEVILRAELMGEMAGGLVDDGGERGIIIVGGYVGRFIDDWCGNDVRIPVIPKPGSGDPVPRPNWEVSRLDGNDLLVIGARFAEAAAVSPEGAALSAFLAAAKRLGARAATML